MTETDTLVELWELSGRGEALWWPSEMHPQDDEWVYRDQHDCIYCIYDHHALDLVTAEAERWLLRQGYGWRFERESDTTCYTPDDYTVRFHSLPEAIKYAMENKREKSK